MRLENRRDSIAATKHSRGRFALLTLVLAAVTVTAYWPSLRGGFIWDDPDYVVNNPTLRSVDGLRAMWTDIHSLPQWYPVVHTTFWVEYQLFGLRPVVYKVTNLSLHIATALLLWRLLRNLEVPGSYLAALAFALHPMHVESVAWITERKNALSGVFYLLAMLAYFRSIGLWKPALEPTGERHKGGAINRQWYLVALTLFAAALLSKTVTASLNAAVLVLIWWKRGRVDRADVLPLVPMFLMGIGMGLVTAGLERHHVGAIGPEWDYSPTWHGELAARTLIAGRAVWFYFGKLVWPHPVAFMYDRWTIDPRDWLQWLYPAAAAVVIVALFVLRNRIGRGPLAAALLFGGTLFPALGFFNVFPHRYSFVADHFQHLASIALTTLICAIIGLWLRRVNRLGVCIAVQAVVVAVLGALTFRQGFAYESPRTLWEDTLAKSPRSWVAHTNLGKLAAERNELPLAIRFHQQALSLAPGVADTWYNMGAVHASRQEWAEATDAFMRVRALSEQKPWSSVNLDAIVGLARIAVLHEHDPVKAEQLYQEAIGIHPRYPPALHYYGRFLQSNGRLPEAILQFDEQVQAAPGDTSARLQLGVALLQAGQAPLAIDQLEAALQLSPDRVDVLVNLGIAQQLAGQRAGAVQSFERALRIDPTNQMARERLNALNE